MDIYLYVVFIVLNSIYNIWRSTAAGIQNKLLTGTIIVIHSEKEVFVVKNTGNIKEIHTYLANMYIYIYIYLEREREGGFAIYRPRFLFRQKLRALLRIYHFLCSIPKTDLYMNKLPHSLNTCSSGSSEVTSFTIPGVVANFQPLCCLSATQKFCQQYNLVLSFPYQNTCNTRY